MKYNIIINQYALMQLTPDINIKEAAVLNFAVDFINCNSKKIFRTEIEGERYTYINYELIKREVPIIDLNNKKVIKRYIDKLIQYGYLRRKIFKNNMSLFALTEKVDRLYFSNPNKHSDSSSIPGTLNSIPPVLNSASPIPSVGDTPHTPFSTPNNNIINNDINNQSEITKLHKELLEFGWTGNTDNLAKDIGLDICLYYWNNQLKGEISKSNKIKNPGGLIRNKFYKDAKVFYDYSKKKENAKELKENKKINELSRKREDYLSLSNNFITDFEKFINQPNWTIEDKKYLSSRDYRIIHDIPLKADGLLKDFLNWALG